jgi:hypothetical protein
MLGRRDCKGDILQVGIKKREKKLCMGISSKARGNFWHDREVEKEAREL